jgi:hypothetical protein
MARADSNITATAPAASRRDFFSTATGLVAGGVALAAAVNVTAIAAAPQDDSELLRLEAEALQANAAATSYDDEIQRLYDIWHREWLWLEEEREAGRTDLTSDQIWEVVSESPQGKEHSRLGNLQDHQLERLDKLVTRIWQTPALTEEGRRAKVSVLLDCIMHNHWKEPDRRAGYDVDMARKLLFEFVGGEPAQRLRDRFSGLETASA